MCKTTELLLPCVQQARAGEAAAQGGAGDPETYGSGGRRGMQRRGREARGTAHLGRRRTKRGSSVDSHGSQLGQPWMAALRFFPDDGERQKMHSLSLRCSWRSRHRPLVLPCAESRRAGGGAWLLWRRQSSAEGRRKAVGAARPLGRGRR
jgi:hypothetical protein